MSLRSDRPTLFLLCWPVVWLAGALAPKSERKQWRSERRRQLFHWCAFLEESDRDSMTARLELSRYCWSCFPDALWLRLPREETLKKIERILRSPQFFLAVAGAALVVVAVASGLFATTRALITRPAYSNPEQLATVAATELYSPFRPGVPLRWVSEWRQKSKTIQGAALYTWKAATISYPGKPPMPVLLGEVSTDFFPLLGVGVEMGRTFHEDDTDSCFNCVVLSYGAWKRLLPADAHPVGHGMSLDGHTYRIIGVLPRQFWFLSQADTIWTLMPYQSDIQIMSLPTGTAGNVNVAVRNHATAGTIVRMRPEVKPAAVAEELRTIAQDTTARKIAAVDVVPLRSHAWQTFYPFGAAFLAAVILAVSLSQFRFREPIGPNRYSLPSCRWRIFFAAETFMFLAAAVLASIELTPALLRMAPSDPSAWLISAWICLALCLVVLMWCLSDQQYRCRVCAYRLGAPLTVGNPLRVLLDRGGTEMVCPYGHGMLHSSAGSSWNESEQWSNFDDSWNSLFGDEQGQK